MLLPVCGFFFFFQAEDGIRDYKVTGVQTCALPICGSRRGLPAAYSKRRWLLGRRVFHRHRFPPRLLSEVSPLPPVLSAPSADDIRQGDGEEQQLALSSQHRDEISPIRLLLFGARCLRVELFSQLCAPSLVSRCRAQVGVSVCLDRKRK